MKSWYICRIIGISAFIITTYLNGSNAHIDIENNYGATLVVEYRKRNPGFQGSHILTRRRDSILHNTTARIVAAIFNRRHNSCIKIYPENDREKTETILAVRNTHIYIDDNFNIIQSSTANDQENASLDADLLEGPLR